MILKQALHVFIKDARGLRYEIAVVLAVIAAFAYHNAVSSFEGLIANRQLYTVLLAAAIWVLTARAIQAEALPGDRQFRVTRPYRRGSLVLAKSLFVAVFLAAPMALSDLVILHGQGLGLFGHDAGGFASEQILRLMFVMVPAIALAAVTRNMLEFVLGSILCVAAEFFIPEALYGLALGAGLLSATWLGYWVGLGLLFVAASVAASQYKARRTWLARAIVVPCIVLSIPGDVSPLPAAAAAISSRLTAHGLEANKVRVGLDASQGEQADQCADAVYLDFPFTIQGLPEGTFAQVRIAKFGIGDFSQPESGFLSWGEVREGRLKFLHGMQIYCQEYRKRSAAPVRVHMSFDVTVFRNPRTFEVPDNKEPFLIPEVGLCRRSQSVDWLDCLTPFHDVRVGVLTNYPVQGPDMVPLPSPFPADPSLSPLSWQRFSIRAELRPPRYERPHPARVTTMERAGGMGAALDLDGVRVPDYVRLPRVNGVVLR